MNDHQAIAERAYYIYLSEGRAEGRALDHWLAAEHAKVSEEISRDSEKLSQPIAGIALLGVIGAVVAGPLGALAGVTAGSLILPRTEGNQS